MPIFNHFGISNLYFSTENKKCVHFFYAHNCVVFMDSLNVVACGARGRLSPRPEEEETNTNGLCFPVRSRGNWESRNTWTLRNPARNRAEFVTINRYCESDYRHILVLLCSYVYCYCACNFIVTICV